MDVDENNTDKKRQKKNDSGVSEETSEGSADDASKRKKLGGDATTATAEFPKIKSKVKNRSYRRHSQPESADSNSSDEESFQVGTSNAAVESKPQDGFTQESKISPVSGDSGLAEPEPQISDVAPEPEDQAMPVASSSAIPDTISLFQHREQLVELRRSLLSISSSSDSMSAMEDEKYDGNGADSIGEHATPAVLLKTPPKHKWFITPEVVNRQFGFSNRKQGSELFQQRMYGSLHAVQRLELMYKLEKHRGCVNSLNFNQAGNLIASGSDDLQVCVWDWAVGRLLTEFDSCHKSNVFQVKFLPLSGGMHLATCARDGQVRFIHLSPEGQVRCSRKLAQHRGPSNKLATQKDSPHVFLSCGEDALVMRLDVRLPKPEKVLFVKEVKKIPLYAIHSNPIASHEFLACGQDTTIRIFDQRNASTPLKKLCPQHMKGGKLKDALPYVTSAVYNHSGTEVLASYNDDDIFLFDTRHSDGADYVHRYQGHRNSATLKGVNFFGPRSEFIVSGSDCGNIFFWERETEAIVQWMAGDENGVVNCLEPHPSIPIIATSGLDEDVKIWVPSCEQEPTMTGLQKTVVTNVQGRDGERSSGYDSIDGQMLWIMWRHIRRTERLHNRSRSSSGENVPSAMDESTSDSEESFSDDDSSSHRQQCNPT